MSPTYLSTSDKSTPAEKEKEKAAVNRQSARRLGTTPWRLAHQTSPLSSNRNGQARGGRCLREDGCPESHFLPLRGLGEGTEGGGVPGATQLLQSDVCTLTPDLR